MTTASKATNLALLISAGQFRGHADIEDSVYDSIAGFMQGYSDEHKADIYARIVEALHPDTNPGFLKIEKAVTKAMEESAKIYGHRD